MTSKPASNLIVLFILGLSMAGLVSCTALAPTPAPTATSTVTAIPTETPLPIATSTPAPLPSPTTTHTAVPTETTLPSGVSVESREQFENLVAAGEIQCQGSETGGAAILSEFIEETIAAGLISEGQLTLGAGIPSTDNPTQCLFLITFNDGNSVILYKDSSTGELVQLPVID